VFESGADREDKVSEAQVGELYRQIGQMKVENDFLARPVHGQHLRGAALEKSEI